MQSGQIDSQPSAGRRFNPAPDPGYCVDSRGNLYVREADGGLRRLSPDEEKVVFDLRPEVALHVSIRRRAGDDRVAEVIYLREDRRAS